jgi:hypothetical protein
MEWMAFPAKQKTWPRNWKKLEKTIIFSSKVQFFITREEKKKIKLNRLNTKSFGGAPT